MRLNNSQIQVDPRHGADPARIRASREFAHGHHYDEETRKAPHDEWAENPELDNRLD